MSDIEIADLVNQARLASLGMLVAGLAHEINTPLGALVSNHDVLRRSLGRLQSILEDEVVEPHELEEVRRVVRALDGILQVNDMAVERMESLVRGLRTFGRVDRADIDRVDLHDLIATTLAIVAHELKGVSVIHERTAPVMVECLPQQINQVILNLVMNARHAMPAGGRLTLEAWDDAGTAALAVTDTGTGMDDATRARIFEPGFTTKGGRIGMGLGLLICSRIIDRHGGRLDVVSEPGRGSTFTVFLPAASEAPEPAPTARAPEARPRAGTETVVVVEDDELVRSLTVRSLEAHGYRVVAFGDPAEALANLPDDVALLVTDVVMPKLNGRELAEKVLRLAPRARVIFVSGYTPDEVLARGVSEDAVEFMQKPFSMDDLARKVRAVLDEDGRAWESFVRGSAVGHAAHVYGDSAELADVAGRFLALGLDEGEPAVAIVAERHRELLAAQLHRSGWSETRLEEAGLLTLLDADETLGEIAPDGRLSRERFDDVVGAAVRAGALRFPGKTVRAFGEMVDILCARGDVGTAIELETLWNGLRTEVRLSLLCGYGVDVFDPAAQTEILAEICRAHTHVLPARDTTRLGEAVDRALSETLGSDAARVHSLAEESGHGSMPHAQRVLLWLSTEMPEVAGIVLATARDHFEQGG